MNARVWSTGQPETFEWSAVTDTGTVSLRDSTAGIPFCHSVDDLSKYWQVDLVLDYKLDGSDYTETVNVPPESVGLKEWRPKTDISYNTGVTTISIGSESGDPFTYSVSGISGIEVDWYDSLSYISSTPVYPGGGSLTTVTPGSEYQYAYPLSSVTPPAEATDYMLYATTDSGFTADADFGSYTGAEGIYIYDQEGFHPISDLTSP